MCRYSPPSMRRVHAEPRSSSSAHCTSSRTSVSPRIGAISAVQQTIGASGLTRSSPVTMPDALVAELGREPAVRLLREHPQRRRIDAAAGLDEEAERVVRLARVGRPEVRDDRLRLGRPVRQPDGELGDGLAARLPALVALAPRRSFLAAPGHGATVPGPLGRGQGERVERDRRAPRPSACAGRPPHGSAAGCRRARSRSRPACSSARR